MQCHGSTLYCKITHLPFYIAALFLRVAFSFHIRSGNFGCILGRHIFALSCVSVYKSLLWARVLRWRVQRRVASRHLVISSGIFFFFRETGAVVENRHNGQTNFKNSRCQCSKVAFVFSLKWEADRRSVPSARACDTWRVANARGSEQQINNQGCGVHYSELHE